MCEKFLLSLSHGKFLCESVVSDWIQLHGNLWKHKISRIKEDGRIREAGGRYGGKNRSIIGNSETGCRRNQARIGWSKTIVSNVSEAMDCRSRTCQGRNIPRMGRRKERVKGMGQDYGSIRFKLNFPRIYGENLTAWLYKAEHYYELDKTSQELKVKTASLHLENRALEWYQMVIRNRGGRWPDWREYIESLETIFGNVSRCQTHHSKTRRISSGVLSAIQYLGE